MPTRTCVVCRTSGTKASLLRLVRTADGQVAVDPSGRAPGRGAYVCDDPSCRTELIEGRALRRALRLAPSTPIDITLEPERAALTSTKGGTRGQE